MTRDSLMTAARIGAIAGGAMVFVVTIGFVETVARREVLADLLSLSTVMMAVVGIVTGVIAARPSTRDPDPSLTTALTRGAVAGVVSGAVLGAFAIFASAVNVRDIFSNLSPSSIETITFDMGPAVGAVILVVGGAVLGAFGAILRILPPLPTRMVVVAGVAIVVLSIMEQVFRVMLSELDLRAVAGFFYRSGALNIQGALVIGAVAAALVWLRRAPQSPVRDVFQRATARADRRSSLILYGVVAVLLLVLPLVVGRFPSDVIGNAGLYILLGLGLNIVVGYAGLLDLGYVAFFAIGSYSVALLTSPQSFLALELNFWLVLPIVILIAAIAGVVIGAPVLRLRGDYLAIVTLGFGEIVRLLFLSDWLSEFTNAGQGILGIPGPTLPGLDFPTRDPRASTTRSSGLYRGGRRRLSPRELPRRPRLERDARGRVGGRGNRHQHHELQAARVLSRRGLRLPLPGRCSRRRSARSSRTASRSWSRSPRLRSSSWAAWAASPA